MTITRRQILGGLGVATLGVIAAPIIKPKPQSNTQFGQLGINPMGKTHGPDYFPNVVLTTHNHKRVKFYDDLLKDKFVVINMIYAQCSEGVCPIATMNMRQVHKALGDRVGRDIHMYSISLLPEHDTPDVLKRYADQFNVGAGWEFLTGTQADIEIVRRKLGFYDLDPNVDKDITQHAGVVRIGYDAYDKWMMAPTLGSHQSILQVIQHADRSHLTVKT